MKLHRYYCAWLCFALAASILLFADSDSVNGQEGPFLANGVKVGEVDQESAIVWVRLTQLRRAELGAAKILREGLSRRDRDAGVMPVNILPGAAGEFRIRFWHGNDDGQALTTEWLTVGPNNDFIRQHKLTGLKPGRQYRYEVECRSPGGAKPSSKTTGHFRTAPMKTESRPVQFIVTTCQAIRSIDDEEGHATYRAMRNYSPDFFVHTGDIVYYDKAPLAKTAEQARAKWHTMFSYNNNRKFLQTVSSYFMKDDHDTLKNDCWPGQKYGDLTFDEGLEIFRQQVPMGKSTYRRVRWGRDLEIWMAENRDFRSPNRMPDGPTKTILGAVQKKWLMDTMRASDATFKVLITPGPIVGPDKKGKNDNHSNPGFQHEGDELRKFLSTLENTFVICGDRHWQYCSQDPQTGVVELGCGPINDQHSFGGNPGRNKQYHRYFSPKGGFLRVSVEGGRAKAEWFGKSQQDSGQFSVLHTEYLSK